MDLDQKNKPGEQSTHVISARHLSKTYQARQVVKDVSLNVKSGEVVGLLGPNGAGKTTSFNMIVGLVPNDAGAVFLNRRDITALPMDQRARLGLGYLPQESSIFRKLTVRDNVLAVLDIRSVIDPVERERRLTDLLQEFHLHHVSDRVGETLSGGERRRTEIARTLAAEPDFIMLDEPFAGVDPLSVLDLQKVIKQLAARGIGILITDHNVRETLGICDRAYIVNEGTIIAEGAPETILANDTVRRVYLGHSFSL
ncbi:MAG: LPS export ABC transporter ATP-binding protein [Pseudomonadota bacterium]|nr:LPS export ABC transporter ATP-binding protein [Pseudomonadota bacterium]